MACLPAMLPLPAISDEATTPAEGSPLGWECKYCAFSRGFWGDVEGGLGYASSDAAKFQDYTGLGRDPFFFADGGIVHYDGNSSYFDLSARDLGLESREISAEGGRQGTYKLFLDYRKLPRTLLQDPKTPFLGAGSDNLTLPPNWVFGRTTGEMTALSSTLQPVDIGYDREDLGLGLSLTPARHWQYAVKYHRTTKEGTKTIAGAFGVNAFAARSAILPEPVDYVTDQVEMTASRIGERAQIQLGYYGSFFRDQHRSLTWQDPYGDPEVFPSVGRLSLPPDNEAHQVMLSGAYRITGNTRATARVALGRMLQNDSFLSYTVNTGLAPPPLPRSSLDGRIDTLVWNVSLLSMPLNKLELAASYDHDEQDNKTPRGQYQYVVADTALSSLIRTNTPYSFTNDIMKLRGTYRLPMHSKVSLGYDHEERERTFQQVSRTVENRVWGELGIEPHPKVSATLRYAHAVRDGGVPEAVAETQPPQNPLLRKLNQADRDSDQVSSQLTFTPKDNISIDLSVDYARDNYSDSQIGVTDGSDLQYTLDLSISPKERLNLHAFVTREQLKSDQQGSLSFSTPDWVVDTSDVIDTFGLGAKLTAIRKRLDIGADYTFSRSSGEIDVSSRILPVSPLPDLVTRFHRAEAYATYHFAEALSLRLSYVYEKYHEDDWTVDGVTPSTISSVLSLGQKNLSYEANMVVTSLRYRF